MRAPLLLCPRDPTDPMAPHEVACFTEMGGVPVEAVYATVQPLAPDLLVDRPAVFVGGSGAYSVLDGLPWIHRLLDFLQVVASSGVPAYASCFGFQGLALALGGRVVTDVARKEVGVFPLALTEAGAADPLFRHLPTRFSAQLGHKDHVVELPAGVTLLVTGENVPNQALRVDGTLFWASQFHPELTRRTTLERLNAYRDLYAENPRELEQLIQAMEEGPDTPHTGVLLARLAEQRPEEAAWTRS